MLDVIWKYINDARTYECQKLLPFSFVPWFVQMSSLHDGHNSVTLNKRYINKQTLCTQFSPNPNHLMYSLLSYVPLKSPVINHSPSQSKTSNVAATQQAGKIARNIIIFNLVSFYWRMSHVGPVSYPDTSSATIPHPPPLRRSTPCKEGEHQHELSPGHKMASL